METPSLNRQTYRNTSVSAHIGLARLSRPFVESNQDKPRHSSLKSNKNFLLLEKVEERAVLEERLLSLKVERNLTVEERDCTFEVSSIGIS